MWDEKAISLIQKYDVMGPRYTSYPTVPQWNDTITSDDFDRLFSKRDGYKTFALYTHIPFCEERCHFCACNVVITKQRENAESYLNYINKELLLYSPLLPKCWVTQIHWGGGTPTYLNEVQMENLFLEYQKYFSIDANAEISIEIDPRVTTVNQLKTLRRLGFNRISMGVQDFDEKVQSAIHRNQTEWQTQKIYEACRELSFRSVNMDFVYGLPFQTLESFEKNLKIIMALKPDRVAMYNYAHVPWMVPSQKYISVEALPSPALKLTFLQSALRLFETSGYLPVGMDHFARPQDELISALRTKTLRRNFMGYTTQKDSLLLAHGVSAIGDTGDFMVQNYRRLSDYYHALDESKLPLMKGHRLSANDQLRRHIIMELLCNFYFDITEVEKKFSISFFEYFSLEMTFLLEMQTEGLIDIQDESISVTSLGKLLIRNICMIFDDYYAAQKKISLKKYSKTI